MKKSLELVKFKNRLLNTHTQADLKNGIISKIQEIPNFLDLKFDVELTLYVCNVVEHSQQENKKCKLDKKQFVIEVLKSLFELSEEDDLKQIDAQIEFLHSNKKIKPIKLSKRIGISLYNWFEKKFL